MKRSVVLVFALLVPLWPQALWARGGPIGPTAAARRAIAPATASIEGVVLRAGTDEPVAGVQVTLMPANFNDGAPSPVTTDNQGRFIVKDLDGGAYGSYRMRFESVGYVSQAYGQKTFPGTGSPITLAVGQAMKGIVMKITPTGAVSGRLRDTSGSPLVGVPVALLRPVYDAQGQRTFQVMGRGRANDRGEYRMYFASPGRYYVVAGGPLSGFGVIGGAIGTVNDPGRSIPNEIPEITVPVFYPNSRDSNGATVIEIRPGVEANGIDFTLKPQDLFRVRGRAIDSRTGQPPARAQVQVSAPLLTGGASRYNGFYNAGVVEVSDLPPGSYEITVTPQPAPGAGPPPERAVATANVTINDADVEGIVWTVVPPSAIVGHVTIDGVPPQTTAGMRFALRPTIPGVIPQSQPPDPSGAFRIDDIAQGEYRIDVSVPPPLYIKGVLLDGADVVGRPIRFSGGTSGTMEVSLSAKSAQVDGLLTDDTLQPIPLSPVVLVPDRLRDRLDLYKMARTDQNGRFTFATVPPGDYKVFAWEAIDQNSWFDPDVLRQFEQKGTPVKLLESSRGSVDVKLIPSGGQ